MSETVLSLGQKINVTHDLYGIVRTMKAIAASNIAQYERAVESLRLYMQAVELGLVACLPHSELAVDSGEKAKDGRLALVIGSDYGMVGQFNEHLVERVAQSERPGSGQSLLWAVGERIQARLEDAGFTLQRLYPAPNSLSGVAPLVAQILLDSYELTKGDRLKTLLVFHNRPKLKAGYEPASQRLLPLDAEWVRRLRSIPWPTRKPPEVIGSGEIALAALIREFFFGSLFRAFTESLAAENASRFAAMQSAERNIEEFQADLTLRFHRQRQRAIDEELADVISGFEALSRR